MGDLKIIQLKPDQWEDYKKLRLKALKENPEAFGESYALVLLRTDDLWKMMVSKSDDDRKRWVFFAKLNGEPVGMVSGQAMESVDGGVKVREMFILEKARRRGIGKRLLEALIQELLKNSDRTVLRLGVLKTQTDAINFYQDLGFKILEEKTEVLPSGAHESLIMEKRLS